ncbi:MAG TPA: glycosyltransferase family 4 protein [Steroidobacteraceae bacterium]|nr:glycosyltransferase family 4 protein [Steroidobacteraceae bacterium]
MTELNQPPARVVFVNRYFAPDESATSRMLSDLAFRLADQGVPVAVVTSRQLYENARAALPPRERIRGVTVHRVNTARWGRARLVGRALDYASFHVAAGFELRRLLRSGDVVVAKTDPPLISIAVAVAARLRGAVLVNWLQDLFPEVASAIAPGAMPRWLERGLVAARDQTLRQAAMNIVLSEGMRGRLLARGVSSAQIRVIPNWADATTVVPKSSDDSVTRRRLGLSGLVVGYSGNLGRAHEFDTLLGAARLLSTDNGISFLITGSGAKAASLQRMVKEEGLDRFVFQDYQPPELLADSLAASDVHVVSLLPRLEGLIVPSKIYGILAAGRPALYIGDPEGDVGRLVRDNACGIAVRCGDRERLASELRALRQQPERLSLMGMRARELALARYRSEHAVSSWLDFLAGIAPQVTRPGAVVGCHTSVTAGA